MVLIEILKVVFNFNIYTKPLDKKGTFAIIDDLQSKTMVPYV